MAEPFDSNGDAKSARRGLGLRARALLLSASALAIALASPAAGQTTNWTSVGDTDWTIAGNWDAGVPTSATTAAVTQVGTVHAILNNAPGQASALVIDAGNVVEVVGASVLTVTGRISVGNFLPGNSELRISGGGTVTAVGAFAGDGPESGTITVTGAGSSLAVTAGAGFSRFVVGAIGQGTLAIANGGTVTVAGSGNLELGGVGGLLNGTLIIGGGGTAGTLTATTVTMNTASSQIQFSQTNSTTFIAQIIGSGSVAQNGTGTTITTLTGANTYSGGTMLNGGTLAIGSNTALGIGALTVSGGSILTTAGGAPITLANNVAVNAALQIATGGVAPDLALGGTISGASPVTKTGDGTLTLTGVNTYSGGTTIGSGRIDINNGNALGTGALTINGGVLRGTADLTLTKAINTSPGGIATILAAAGTNLTLDGGNIGGTLLGTIVFGSATDTGTVTYQQGGVNYDPGGATLEVAGGTLFNGFNIDFITNNVAATTRVTGGTLDFNNVNATINNLQGTGGVVDAGTGNLTVHAGNYAGNISAASLTKDTPGVLTLSGNNTFTNGVTLSGGTLSLQSNNAAGGAASTITTLGSVIDYGDGVTIANPIVVDSATTQLQVLTGTATQSGDISELNPPRPIEKIGAGTLILSGTNTYTGPTTISAGTLQLLGGAAIVDTGAVIVANVAGATLAVAASETIGTLFGGGTTGGSVAISGGQVLTTGGAGPSTFAGSISGAGGLTINGGGNTFTLTGANTYTGATTITAGTLQLGDGATNGSLDAASAIAVTGTLALNPAASTSMTVGNVISGAGAINQVGAGTSVLTGNSNTFTGTTRVNAGVLRVDGILGGALSTLIVNTGGTLMGSGTVGGNVAVNSGGALSAGASPGTFTIGGNLTLNAGSASNFELNTPNVVGGVGPTGNDLVDVGGSLTLGGTLNVNAPSAGYYRLFNHGTPGGFPTGSFATVNVTGFAGTPTVLTNIQGQVNFSLLGAGQQMQFWDGADTAGAIPGAQGGTATWSATSTNWAADPVAGQINDQWRSSVGVFQGTAGTVTVDGTQAFDTLQFNTSGYILATGVGGQLAIGVAGGGTINVNGVTTIINTPIVDGAGAALTIVGGGTLTLGGNNAFSGGLTVNNAAVIAAANGALGAGNVTLNAGAITVNGGTTQSVAAIAVNGGTFTNAGTTTATGGTTNNSTFSNTGTLTSAVVNASVFTNSGALNGAVNNSSGFTNSGSVAGPVTNSGTYAQSAGTTAGGFTNTGTVSASGGAINGAITNSNVFSVTGPVLGTGPFTNNQGATLSVTGTYTLTGDIFNSGVILNNGALTAANLTNAATGVVTNNGTLTDVLNNAGLVDNNGTYNANVATNSGTINNNNLWNGNVLSSTGTINNAGTWNGNVITSGVFNNNAGTITNGVNNSGTLNANGGAVNGPIVNSGTFNVLASTTGNNVMTNSGALNLTGDFTGLTAINNTGGAINYTGARSIGPANLNNSGVLNPASITSSLTTSGSLTGNGVINAFATSGAASLVTATGAASSGTQTFIFNGGAVTPGVFFASPVTVLDLGGGTLTVNQGIVNNLSNGFVNNFLVQAGAGGDATLQSQFNAAPVGGVATSLNGVLTALVTSFHQPASAIVSRPDDPRPNQIGGGPFIRFSAGDARIDLNGTAGGEGLVSTSLSRTKLHYTGFQAGLDLGVYNIQSTGWNFNFGLMAGQATASARATTSTPAPAGPPIVVNTAVELDVPFFGAYAFLSNGPFTAEFNVRRDFYDWAINSVGQGGIVFVDPNTRLSGNGTNFNLNASYRFIFAENWYVEPTAGVSKGRYNFGTLPLALGPGDFMTFTPSDSILGRVGFNAGALWQATEKLVLAPFVHASVWREFADDTEARATLGTLGVAFNVETERVGTFGQVGAGVQFKVLDSPFLGFVRGDYRFGEKINGKAFNVGLKMQF